MVQENKKNIQKLVKNKPVIVVLQMPRQGIRTSHIGHFSKSNMYFSSQKNTVFYTGQKSFGLLIFFLPSLSVLCFHIVRSGSCAMQKMWHALKLVIHIHRFENQWCWYLHSSTMTGNILSSLGMRSLLCAHHKSERS